jgi:hypothetical protein
MITTRPMDPGSRLRRQTGESVATEGMLVRVRITRLLLAVAMVTVGLGLFAPTSAPASCVGPRIAVPGAATLTPSAEPTDGRVVPTVRLSPGQPITVEGRWFFNGCNDTGGGGGCSGPDRPDPEKPARDVRLTLTQGSRHWTLGTADAAGPSREYAVRWRVRLPADLAPGGATLTARTAELRVEVQD